MQSKKSFNSQSKAQHKSYKVDSLIVLVFRDKIVLIVDSGTPLFNDN